MMKEMSLTRKILLGIVSSPLFVIGLCLCLLTISLLWFIIPILLLITLIDVIKGDEDALETAWGFLKFWCLIGLCVYFDTVWDYELFDY